MANKIIFDALPTPAVIMAADAADVLLSLEVGGIAVSSEVANGVAANNTMASFQLYIGKFAAAPTAGGYFECHIVYKMDDTLFADGETGDVADPNLSAATLVGIFPIFAADEPQLIALNHVPLQPFDFKVCIVNKTSQALGDGDPDTSTLKAFLYSLEVQ